MSEFHIDSPDRYDFIQSLIRTKRFLNCIYREDYSRFKHGLSLCPGSKPCLEIGSGAGFLKDIIPEVITSDIIPYKGVDRVIDATSLPFEDESLRAIFLYHCFHHIPDVGAFLVEAQRCLVPGGRVFITDPHPGIFSTPINTYLHHEGFDTSVEEWAFQTSGPLSDGNGALAWNVFSRDREIFVEKFPEFVIESYTPHTSICWWVSGSLLKWSLFPGSFYRVIRAIDRLLLKASLRLGSFVDVTLRKRDGQNSAFN